MEGPHKVLVVGEPGCGKTSLVRRLVEGVFDKQYAATLGVDFALWTTTWGESQREIRCQLWDIAGQERFSVMCRVYYKQATACVIVFDISRRSTFQEVLKWKEDLDDKTQLPNGDPLPCILLANKCDLPEQEVTREEIQAMCDEHGFIGWIETSAKDDVNVNKAMNFLLQHILAAHIDEPVTQSRTDLVSLQDPNAPPSGCFSCSKN